MSHSRGTVFPLSRGKGNDIEVAAPAGASASGAASSSFCEDTAQLQDWLAQDFRPGIDQYNVRPNTALVLGMAQYLHKLGEESPAAAKEDVGIWAAFTQQVADQASQDDLAGDVPAARAAASRVEVWLAKESGCEQLASAAAPSPPARTSQGILLWVIGVLVVLLILRGLSGPGRVPGGGQSSVPPTGKPSAFGPMESPDRPELLRFLTCRGPQWTICPGNSRQRLVRPCRASVAPQRQSTNQ